MPYLIVITLCCMAPTKGWAQPLLLRWGAYQSAVPAERLVVYRSVDASPLTPVAVLSDTKATAWVDTVVIPARRYCYELRAVTATGSASTPSTRKCAKPNT